MRPPRPLRPYLCATLLLPFAFAACDARSDPTGSDPFQDPELRALVEAVRGAEEHRAAVSPTLLRLLGHSLQAFAGEHGRDAVQALTHRIATLRQRLHDAHQSGDGEAYRAAAAALEVEAARVVLRVLGRSMIERLIESGQHGIDALRRRAAALDESAREAHALRAAYREASALHDRARHAAAAGDLVTALRLAARVLDVLSNVAAAAASGTGDGR